MIVLVTNLSRKLQNFLIPVFLIVGASMFAISSANAGVNESDDCLAPVFTNYPSASVNKSHCSAYTFDFDATDGGNAPAADPVTYATSVGTINPATGQLSVPTLPTCGTTQVVVTATNSCGASTGFSFAIVWTDNAPTISNAPIDTVKFMVGSPRSFDFNSVDADPCDAAYWSVASLDSVVNTPTISGNGIFTWIADASERGMTRSFEVTITESCGGTAIATLVASVFETTPLAFEISKSHNGQLGQLDEVTISKVAGEQYLGGFDFLVSFDYQHLSFLSAMPGSALGPTGCDWEYFTYRYIPFGDGCSSNCLGAVVRITATADVLEVGGTPNCNLVPNGTEVAKLKFYITNDRRYDCWFFPIRFAWRGCTDNTVSNFGGDTLWISERVFDYYYQEDFPYSNFEITDTICYPDISFGGACNECENNSETNVARNIYFRSGGIDVSCDGLFTFGDLNLNDIAFEIADARLYTNYFLYGLGALDPNPGKRSEQIAESDVNQDGVTLSPADLAYLLRVIVGDALPMSKLQPFSSSARIDALGGMISFESADSIGAAYLVFDVTGDVAVTNLCDLQLDWAIRDGKVHMLLWPGLADMSNHMPTGLNAIANVEGAELESVMLSDYEGNVMVGRISRHTLPTQFALAQNFPNPFNPLTRINLELPEASDWQLDVYNVNGQHIAMWSGRGVGIVSIDWDATDQPSGVYFYKLSAGSFVTTKKMVLLK